MKESVNILQDMPELALQATNDTYGADERKALLAVLAAAQITGAHARLIARIQDKLEASLLP